MNRHLLSSALAATLAFSLAACGKDNSIGPQISLTEEQTADMLDALGSLGNFQVGFGSAMVSPSVLSIVRNPNVALLTENIDETESCPNGGTQRVQGPFTINDDFTAGNLNLTISLSNCRSTSSSGTLWTFNGAPNIKLVMNFTINAQTGAFTLNGTQKGALNVSSSMGSGACSVDLSLNFTGSETSFSGSVTGTLCGKPVNESFSETF